MWIPNTEGHLSKDLPELQHLGFHLLFAKGTIKDTGQKAFHLQSSSAPLSDTSSPHLTGHCPLRGLLCLLRAALCPVRRLLCHCYGSSSNMHQTAPSLQASTCHSRGLRPSCAHTHLLSACSRLSSSLSRAACPSRPILQEPCPPCPYQATGMSLAITHDCCRVCPLRLCLHQASRGDRAFTSLPEVSASCFKAKEMQSE